MFYGYNSLQDILNQLFQLWKFNIDDFGENVITYLFSGFSASFQN